MIHTETPLWLYILMSYGIYIFSLGVLRFFYYRKGIKFLLQNFLIDISILIALDFISRASKLGVLYVFIILIGTYVRGVILSKDGRLKFFLVELGFLIVGFISVLLPDLINIYRSVGHIW